MNTILHLDNIDKFYGAIDQGVHAVKGVNLSVEQGDIVALLGSSGCGKTSILRMIAGFESTSRGNISLADRHIHNLPPRQRSVAMAFEGYALYPTVSVGENIAFALKAQGLDKNALQAKVLEVARMLEIEAILQRMPNSLSGGQQQRVSLARALIRDADIYLLDEPMGQLEPQLRSLLRGRIKQFIKQRGMTAILVTHDQTEANALADHIAVMEAGVLQQYASPEVIKNRPANLFTGTFIGEPPMNTLTADVSLHDNSLHLRLAGGVVLTYATSDFAEPVYRAMLQRQKVLVGIRPYAVHRRQGGVEAQVIANQWLGDQSHIAARFASTNLVLVEHDRADVGVGDAIGIHIKPADMHIFDVNTGAAVSHGEELA